MVYDYYSASVVTLYTLVNLASHGHAPSVCNHMHSYSEFASSGMKVYIEGTLMKRPRGRRKHPHLSRKFQERFFRLTLVSLKYYVREVSMLVMPASCTTVKS